MNLYLDSETTGLNVCPKTKQKLDWQTDYERFPYIVELAWKVNGKEKCFIINQEGRKIPKEAIRVHGITDKMANDPEKTQPASFVLLEITMDALKCGNIIGHNPYFDISIIKANILRVFGPDSKEAKMAEQAFHKDKRIDTMRGSQKLFGKWPKLSELYEFLFKKSFNKHRAMDDVNACEKCYRELVRIRIM